MENLFKRHANLSMLGVLLFAQLLGLAVQIKVENGNNSTRLIRRWAVAAISPVQKAFFHSTHSIGDVWHGYFWLRGVRQENAELRSQLDQLKLEQVRLREDAAQARRIQYLLGFKEQYISKTVAAQVIGSSGSEHSKLVYIDKGLNDGLKPDLAVITPQGVVGKTIEVGATTSQVLLINDQSSGVGAILTNSRLQGILKGAPGGVTMLNYIMADERIEPGETVVTSGGDKIFPKGLPVGKVGAVTPGRDVFLTIKVTPAANLSQIEEVLVITEVKESAPDVDLTKGPIRASDILAERLPSVPPKPVATGTAQQPAGTAGPAGGGAATQAGTAPPAAPGATTAPPRSGSTTLVSTPAASTSTTPAAKPPVSKPGAAGNGASAPTTVNGASAPKATTQGNTVSDATVKPKPTPAQPTATPENQ